LRKLPGRRFRKGLKPTGFRIDPPDLRGIEGLMVGISEKIMAAVLRGYDAHIGRLLRKGLFPFFSSPFRTKSKRS